jgi:PAS domain-containing protein
MSLLMESTPLIHRSWFVLDKGVHYNDRYFYKEYVNKSGVITENDTISDKKYWEDPQTAPWYSEPFTTGEIYVQISNIDDFDGAVAGAYSAIISVPVLANGKIIGVCCADVLYRDLLDQLYELQLKQERVMFLLNQDMTILNAHDQQYTGKNLADFGFAEIDAIRGAIEQGKMYSTELMSPILHEKTFLYLQPISFAVGARQQHLYLQIGTPLRTLYADAYRFLVIIVSANLLSMLFIIFMIFWGSNRIVEPIRILARKAQRVASGDFGADIFDSSEGYPRGKSETATLQRAFKEMLRALQENLLTVEKRVEERTLELDTVNNYITLLMNSTTSYSLLLDRDWKILYLSDSLSKLTGLPDIGQFIGLTYLDVFKSIFKDGDFVAAASGRLSRVMAGEELVEDDTVVWPGGERVIYRLSYNRMTDENDEFAGIILAAQDITALRFEEAERRLDDMLHSTSLPCVIWDMNGDVMAFNEETTNIFGIPYNISLEDFQELYFSIQPERQPNGTLTRDLRRDDIAETLKTLRGEVYQKINAAEIDNVKKQTIFSRVNGVEKYLSDRLNGAERGKISRGLEKDLKHSSAQSTCGYTFEKEE